MPARKTAKEEEEKVIDFYNSGVNATEISRQLKVSRRHVYRILDRNNVELQRKTSERRCVFCDKDFVSASKNRCSTCNTAFRRYRTKKKAIEYKGCKCSECGWYGDMSGFDFHHVDGKDFNLSASRMASLPWEKVKAELDRCVLLCALCHRLEHSNYKLFEEMLDGKSECSSCQVS